MLDQGPHLVIGGRGTGQLPCSRCPRCFGMATSRKTMLTPFQSHYPLELLFVPVRHFDWTLHHQAMPHALIDTLIHSEAALWNGAYQCVGRDPRLLGSGISGSKQQWCLPDLARIG